MTATTTRPAPTPATTPSDDRVPHLVCCHDDIAMCGTDVSGENWVDEEDPADNCKLCAYIDDEGLPCPLPDCTGGDQ